MPNNAGHSGSSVADGVYNYEPENPPNPPGSQSTPVSPSEKQSADVNVFPGEVTKTAAVRNTESSGQPNYDEPSSPHDEQDPEDGLCRLPTEGPPSDASALRNSVSRVTTDAEGNTYPEGGLRAWLVVFGSFMGLFGALGLLNTIGTFQAYIEGHQLEQYSSGDIGWVFGMYAFLTFFCGIQIGPIFDARGPVFLVIAGSALVIAQMVAVGFCTEYWHFMLTIGVAGGMGASLIFTPAISAVSHWFLDKRAYATGIAATGGSVGGVVFPLTLQALFPKIGFAWATRAVALICLVLVATSCLLVRSRLPKKPFSRENVLPDFRIFREPKFALTTAGIFFVEFGLFVPISYISSYALAHGVSTEFSYQLLAILNAGSFFGRWLPGLFADFLGRFNILIATVALCLLCNVCLWLPANGNVPLIVVYAAVFGFASGSNISLAPVCIGQLCKTEHYGRYYATSYTVVSFGTLTGIPIAGEILARCNGEYWGVITFTICCYAAGLVCVTAVKLIHVGWRQPWAVY